MAVVAGTIVCRDMVVVTCLSAIQDKFVFIAIYTTYRRKASTSVFMYELHISLLALTAADYILVCLNMYYTNQKAHNLYISIVCAKTMN